MAIILSYTQKQEKTVQMPADSYAILLYLQCYLTFQMGY
jgi:hypothetical protein